MKRQFKTSLAALALAFLTSAAQAIPLSDLFNGGSITAGDKLFDRWSLIDYTATDGRDFNATNIDVTALNDGGLNPGPGLNFEVLNNELFIEGDGVFAFVDLFFGFRVSVLDPNLGVNGILLSLGVSSLPTKLDGVNDSGVFIRETIGTGAGADDLGNNAVENSIFDNVGTTVFDDSSAFTPRSQVFVTKNILVHATDEGDFANLQSFQQRFAQGTIPEPGSLALSLLALVGVGALQRRRVLKAL